MNRPVQTFLLAMVMSFTFLAAQAQLCPNQKRNDREYQNYRRKLERKGMTRNKAKYLNFNPQAKSNKKIEKLKKRRRRKQRKMIISI